MDRTTKIHIVLQRLAGGGARREVGRQVGRGVGRRGGDRPLLLRPLLLPLREPAQLLLSLQPLRPPALDDPLEVRVPLVREVQLQGGLGVGVEAISEVAAAALGDVDDDAAGLG